MLILVLVTVLVKLTKATRVLVHDSEPEARSKSTFEKAFSFDRMLQRCISVVLSSTESVSSSSFQRNCERNVLLNPLRKIANYRSSTNVKEDVGSSN